MDAIEGTNFLNVDLDIFSRLALDPVVEAFGRKVDVLHVGRRGRRYSARVELTGVFGRIRGDRVIKPNPDRVVRRLVALVNDLPPRARRLWDEAQAREFNIGIQAVRRSPFYEIRLQPETLEAVAEIGGRIVVTVYAPERGAMPSRKRSRT